jgi:TrkA-N domain
MTERSSDPNEHDIQPADDESTPARSWTYQVGAWLFLVAVALCLGATGFVLVVADTQAPVYLPDVLYNAMQLFFLQFTQTTSPLPWQLEIARWMAPLLSGYAIYKGLESVLRDRFQRLRVLLRYRDHVILCGLGRKALRLATAYRRQGLQVVVIEKDPQHPMIDICRHRGMAVLVGDATSPLTLRQAQLVRAERLIALGPDLANLEIAFQAERLLAQLSPPPRAMPCFVHVEDSVVCRNLRDAEAGRHRSLVVREYFNIDEIAARALVTWERCPAFPKETASPWHLVVVGLGPTGLALVIEAARRWSGRPSPADRGQLWITAVDRQASDRLASLANRFPWIKEACRLNPRNLEEHDADFEACEFLAASGAPPPARVYVVSQDEEAALRAALLIWQYRHASGAEYPIVLRTVSNLGLARLLPGADQDDLSASIGVFSLLDHAWSPDLLIPSLELLARAIHERYLAQRRSQGVEMRSRPAMRPWDELAEFYRDSNRQQAASLPRTLRLDGRRRYDIVQAHRKGAEPFVFPPEDLERIARNEHERFLEERKRTEPGHPDLVSWDDLPETSKETARQQIREWPQVLASVDLTLSLKSS